MPASQDPSTTDAARRALDSLMLEFEAAGDTQSDAQRWAIYGYVYGLRHADALSADDFDAYLDRLAITADEAEDANVAL